MRRISFHTVSAILWILTQTSVLLGRYNDGIVQIMIEDNSRFYMICLYVLNLDTIALTEGLLLTTLLAGFYLVNGTAPAAAENGTLFNRVFKVLSLSVNFLFS